MKASVYYDYFEGRLAPLWYVLSFQKGAVDWNETTLFLPIDSPFQRQELDDFHAHSLGLTVTLGEMILSTEKPGTFGIYLPRLKRRAMEAGYGLHDVELLIMQVADLEELFEMRLFALKRRHIRRQQILDNR